VNASNTGSFGSRNQDSSRRKLFVPWDQWIKLSQDQKDRLIAERQKERMSNKDDKGKVYQRQANAHDVDDVVDLDDIIDYNIMNHDVSIVGDGSDDNNTDGNSKDDSLLAYMAGRSTSAGELRQVLAAKTKPPNKNKVGTTTSRKVNAGKSTPSTIQVDDTTYYLYKGETIEVDGQQYVAHMANVHYWIGRHNITAMEHALVDRGANGGICGDDMLVLEGSERFVDVSGLAGHKVSQLRIVTAQALVHTHKGDVIATFHQMALLGTGKSILSCLQMEAYGADINDRSCSIPGGKQRILVDGYQLPLQFENGLPYL
jgi:hypothetical protein